MPSNSEISCHFKPQFIAQKQSFRYKRLFEYAAEQKKMKKRRILLDIVRYPAYIALKRTKYIFGHHF